MTPLRKRITTLKITIYLIVAVLVYFVGFFRFQTESLVVRIRDVFYNKRVVYVIVEASQSRREETILSTFLGGFAMTTGFGKEKFKIKGFLVYRIYESETTCSFYENIPHVSYLGIYNDKLCGEKRFHYMDEYFDYYEFYDSGKIVNCVDESEIRKIDFYIKQEKGNGSLVIKSANPFYPPHSDYSTEKIKVSNEAVDDDIVISKSSSTGFYQVYLRDKFLIRTESRNYEVLMEKDFSRSLNDKNFLCRCFMCCD